MFCTITSLCLQNAGLVLILLSLLFSWVLVYFRYILKVEETKVKTDYILKGHIDFFLMGIMLILFSQLDGTANSTYLLFTIIGAFTNPTLFLILAFKPTISKSPKSLFGISISISYLFSTIGVSGICFSYLFAN